MEAKVHKKRFGKKAETKEEAGVVVHSTLEQAVEENTLVPTVVKGRYNIQFIVWCLAKSAMYCY